MALLSTGVADLDVILGGGLESGSLVVIAGAPGTGKTLLAQQICFANATPERKAVYYTTLQEPHSKLVKHLEPFEFFKRDAIGVSVEFVHLGDFMNEGDDALQPIVAEVVQKSMDSRPSLIVIDSARSLNDFFNERSLRRAIYDMASRVAHTGAVLMFVGEYTEAEIRSGRDFALADGILELAYDRAEPMDRRWLRVIKLRGAQHLEGKHSFHISAEGLQIFPRLETITPQDAPGLDQVERMSIGVPALDEMMGGGMHRTDATAFMGPSGCGKTALALRYVAQGIEEGERCLYVSFQETQDQLLGKAASFGWDLTSARDSGQLAIYHVPQGRLDLDAIGAVLRRELETRSIRRVVFDSLAELVMAASEGQRFPAFARSLLGLVRAAGASAVITGETVTLGPDTDEARDLLFLFQNVLLLRYIEIESEIRRALAVVKMRDSDH